MRKIVVVYNADWTVRYLTSVAVVSSLDVGHPYNDNIEHRTVHTQSKRIE